MIYKTPFIMLFIANAATAQVTLQAPPFQTETDRAALRSQAGAMFDALSPLTQEAGKSAVWIWHDGKRQLAIGTVIGEGDRVLTKWSEIAQFKDKTLQCVTGSNQTIKAIVAEVYEEEDIAVLRLEEKRLKPVDFTNNAKPPLGSFLIAAGPGDNPLGLGVVSVNERSLRAKDQAFVGVMVNDSNESDGVTVEEVVNNSPAEKAGIEKGDVILQLDDDRVKGGVEFRALLARMKPLQEVKCLVRRGGGEQTFELKLGKKAENSQLLNRQNQVMERMGGDISEVRDGFPAVIQSDLVLNPEECGAPVFDIEGKAVGIAIARSGRVRSYVISAARLSEMLKSPGVEPSIAKVRASERGPQLSRNRAVLPRLNREQMQGMRARMQEMRKFMRDLDGEIMELDR